MEKKFTAAEKERLIEVAKAAQLALEERDKFIDFLRKQHDAIDASFWNVTVDGFVAAGPPREPASAPAPVKPKKGSKKADEIATKILYPDGASE